VDPDPDDPFGGIPFLGDLARMMGQQAGSPADTARQIAVGIATGGESEPNVDPLDRVRLEDLARVAELHVAQATGTAVPVTKGPLVEPVTKAMWVGRTLDAWRPYLDLLGAALTDTGPADPEPSDPSDPMAALAPLLAALTPALVGITTGSMVGNLARSGLGAYDLPLPRPAAEPLPVVIATLDAFGSDWSLPTDDLRLWLCLHEVAAHTVIQAPHVRARLDALLREWLVGFDSGPDAVGEQLAGLDPSSLADPAALQEMLGNPEALLGAIRSPDQEALRPLLDAHVAAVVGLIDHVMDRAGEHLLSDYGRISEAMRRRRVEATEADRFVERLFGFELGQDTYERGRSFADGVVERSDEGTLLRLLVSDRELPTPSEVDAPGLWLARIDLPDP
jgi:putative hydrolase